MNQATYYTVYDFNNFITAHPHHAAMIKQWKLEIENRRDKARNYLVSGEDTVEIRNDDTQFEVVIADISTSPVKEQTYHNNTSYCNYSNLISNKNGYNQQLHIK